MAETCSTSEVVKHRGGTDRWPAGSTDPYLGTYRSLNRSGTYLGLTFPMVSPHVVELSVSVCIRRSALPAGNNNNNGVVELLS